MLAAFFADTADASRIVAVPRSTPNAPVPAVDALMILAETTRGELLALRKDLEAATLSGAGGATGVCCRNRRSFVGTKSSTASGGDVGSGITIGGGDIGPVFGVHATIPLFDRVGSGTRAGRREGVTGRGAGAAFRHDAAGDSHGTPRRGHRATRSVLNATGRARSTDAAEIERIAQVSYDAGERGILELLDAYRLGASARVRQAALDLAVRQAEIELEFVSGWEIPL